jgi:hypothetical protein
LQSGDLQEHNALKEEACMDGPHGKEKGRRLFMKKITALGAAGLPFAVAPAFGAGGPLRSEGEVRRKGQ